MVKRPGSEGAKEVRLSGGDFRGRRLKGAPGIRPLPAMIRESLFSILGDRIEGRKVLDLFAGTGSVAFEALGRGAASADLVESSRGALAALRHNVESLGIQERVRVIEGDVLRVLGSGRLWGNGYGFIFVGPPFDRRLCGATLERLTMSVMDPADSIVAVQASPREELADRIGILERFRLKDFGDNRIHFYSTAATAGKAQE